MTMSQQDDIRVEMESHYWWHSIALGDGLVTRGAKSPELMAEEIRNTFDGLSLQGKSVLDIGAWNGGFSIEAKRRGARRVVALDRPNVPNGVRESLDFAIRTSGLAIERVERDIEEPGALNGLGQFDVVLFLGVLYHLVDPVLALRQIFAVTKEAMVLETYVEISPDPRPLMVFYPSDELGHDPSNWWGPNIACVEHLLRTVGFSRTETIQPNDANRILCRGFP